MQHQLTCNSLIRSHIHDSRSLSCGYLGHKSDWPLLAFSDSVDNVFRNKHYVSLARQLINSRKLNEKRAVTVFQNYMRIYSLTLLLTILTFLIWSSLRLKLLKTSVAIFLGRTIFSKCIFTLWRHYHLRYFAGEYSKIYTPSVRSVYKRWENNETDCHHFQSPYWGLQTAYCLIEEWQKKYSIYYEA